MASRPAWEDHGGVLLPSWPVPERFTALTTPQVRRRVDAAQRRGLRAALRAGGGAIAVFVAIDASRSVLVLGDAGREIAIVQAGEVVVVALLIRAAAGGLVRAELLAMAMAVLIFGVGLVRLWLLPASEVLSVAYLATIVVGSGLFLSWSPRWHAAWLATALAMLAGALLVLPGLSSTLEEQWNIVVALAGAGIVSLVGQRLWQGRLLRMLEQQFELRAVNRYARRQEVHVTELNRELNRVARRDPLTGVGNRFALDEAIGRLLDQGDRLRPLPFALVLLDIDDFKAYNDEHGHLAGDAALGRLGEILRSATRGDDRAFRFGGEEFLLLLPEVGLREAIGVAERVRIAAAEDREGGVPAFTVSGGVALCDPADGRDPAPLLRRADAALYVAKRSGRNRIAADELSIAMQREGIASA